MRRLLLLCAAAWLAALCIAPHRQTSQAQVVLDYQINPDISLPPRRTEDNVNLGVREARQRMREAVALEREGKPEAALDKWRDAWGRYDNLQRNHLKPDTAPELEVLVKDDSQAYSQKTYDELVYSEKWVPLADHINDAFRGFEWPRALRERWIMRQQAQGAEMLSAALSKNDMNLLRRCARFYQYSDAGRTALALMAQVSLEGGDAVSARRWLSELAGAWPEHFDRDPMLNLMMARACRELDARLGLDLTVRRIERAGDQAKVDAGGQVLTLADHLKALAAAPIPAERPELRAPGWLTMQGGFDRNGVAPPVVEITGIVPLGTDEKNPGYKLADAPAKPVENDSGYYRQQEEGPVTPVIFPSAHEAGFFLHRPQGPTATQAEQLLWFRHGREGNPVQLEVPKSKRYTARNAGNSGGWWGYRQGEPRERFRTLASTIATLRWPLDNRESDVLFAVMGQSSPVSERPSEPTGNQIQSFDVSSDMALRLTLPNRSAETQAEWAFLQHVTFMGAPVVVDNKLYIAGAIPETSSVEFWVLCFDVTPKGDPGEGKLLWRTHCCSWKNTGNYYGGRAPVQITDMSSMSMQGGLLYLSTQSGATAAVDRASGELTWVTRYKRPPQSTMSKGWFNNAPVAACGMVVTAPYDSMTRTGAEIALVNESNGSFVFEQPRRGLGYKGEYQYMLGVVNNTMIIQGRTRLHCIALSSFRREGKHVETDFGLLAYQSSTFKGLTAGRGVIAGNRVLVPLRESIAIYDVSNGKLMSEYPLAKVKLEGGPVTLTVYCRGESYKDEDGVVRYRPAAARDPATGNSYNLEHLPAGAEFKFPSGGVTTVKKETFVLMASSTWVYLFTARDS